MQNFLNGIAKRTKTAGRPNPAAENRTAPRRQAGAKAAAGKPDQTGTDKAGAGRSGAKKAAGKKTASSKPAAKSAAQKSAAQKSAAQKSAAKKPSTRKSPAKKSPAKRTPSKKSPAKKGAAAAAGRPSGPDGSLTQHRLPVVWRVLILVAAFAGMVAFAVALSKLTLAPSAASESLVHDNLRPGDSIRDYLAQPGLLETLKQLGGNIVLGMPFGALLPALVPRTRGLLRVMAATALVMLLVELVQGALVQGRAFDIDDVILNTTGSLLGYLIIGRRLGRAVHPRRRHWWHRLAPGASHGGS